MTDTAARSQSITDEFAREAVQRYVTGWASHDPEQLVKLTTEDVHWEDPFIYPDGALHGQAALREWLAYVLRALPDVAFQMVGEPLIALDRSRLMFEWVGTGRMTGALDPPGFAPTGGNIDFRGVDTHAFRDGLISHVWTVTDTAAAARQFGAMPPPGSIGEKLGVSVQHLMAKRLRRKG